MATEPLLELVGGWKNYLIEAQSHGVSEDNRHNTAITEKEGLNITSETTIPDWHGDRMDDDLAVMGMLQCREDWFENLGMRST